MPSFEKVKAWLEGKEVAGLPSRKPTWDKPESEPDINVEAGPGSMDSATFKIVREMKNKYKIGEDGTDALILFGKHRGKTVVWVAQKDLSYLSWMLKQEFPKDLLDVVKHVYEQAVPF